MRRKGRRTERLCRPPSQESPTPSAFAVNCWGRCFCAQYRPLSEPFHELILSGYLSEAFSWACIEGVTFLFLFLHTWWSQWIGLTPSLESIQGLFSKGSRKANPGWYRKTSKGFSVPGGKWAWQSEEGRKREDCKGAGAGNEVLDLSTSSTAQLTATFLPLLVSLLPATYRRPHLLWSHVSLLSI